MPKKKATPAAKSKQPAKKAAVRANKGANKKTPAKKKKVRSDKGKRHPAPKRNANGHRAQRERSKMDTASLLRRIDLTKAMIEGASTGDLFDMFPKISKRTIEEDIAHIKAEWRRTYLDQFAEHIARTSARTERVIGEAFGEWQKGKATKEGPNPKYLDIILNAGEKYLNAIQRGHGQDQSLGAYQIVTVVLESRDEAAEAMNLPQFRHQFGGRIEQSGE